MDDFINRLSGAVSHVDGAWTSDRTDRALDGLGRKRARRAAVRAGGTAALVAVAAFFGYQRLSGEPAPVAVQTTPATARPAPAPPPTVEPLPEPTVIALADGATARPDRDAELEVLSAEPDEVAVRVGRGTAVFDNPRERPIRIVAGQVDIAVFATQFSVARYEQRAELWSDDEPLRLEWNGRVRAVPAGERAVFDTLAFDGEGFEAREAAPRSVAPSARKRPAAPAGPAKPAERAERSVIDELLATADRARIEGRADDAVAPLREVTRAHARDARAPLAAFTLGRVLLDELDRPAAAASAFKRARDLAPEGSLAEDALAREVEAWARAGQSERARERGSLYLQTYPRGHRLRAVKQYAGL